MWYASNMKNDNPPHRVIAKIQSRLEVSETGCWIWPGATASGYGRIAWHASGKGTWGAVHRIMYTYLVGAIPAGLDLDHLCHNPKTCTAPCIHRACANPSHLEPVSRRVNLLRGGTIPAERAGITHCPSGHPYTEPNTLTDKEGRRYCRECKRIRNRAYYHRNKEKRAAYNKAWREARVLPI